MSLFWTTWIWHFSAHLQKSEISRKKKSRIFGRKKNWKFFVHRADLFWGGGFLTWTGYLGDEFMWISQPRHALKLLEANGIVIFLFETR